MNRPEGEVGSFLTLSKLRADILETLQASEVEDAETSARWIVAEATGLSPESLVEDAETALTQGAVARADAMCQRRALGEPLQYVLGNWTFRYLDLAVDGRALIPRPETEVVAGYAIDLLKSRRNVDGEKAVVADLGTGSGAIALSIACELSNVEVHATDLSHEALALARSNLAGLGVAGVKVNFYKGDWFDALPEELAGGLDLLISNPPYVPSNVDLPPAVADWEPSMALVAEQDGFIHLALLTRSAREWLRPSGWLVLECGSEQTSRLHALAIARGFEDVTVGDDLSGASRFVVARKPIDDVANSQRLAAEQALRNGELVVAPTDTLPGLLASYADEAAVMSSYRAKDRPFEQPVPILVSGIEQAEQLVVLNDKARLLLERHWPGALTIVAERRNGVDPVHGSSTLGVRCPEPGWLRLLIDNVGPVTGSSANLHGEEPADSADVAAQSLIISPAVVVQGAATKGLASTVVDTTGEGLVVLREGAISSDDL